jgi:hypothetical protein
LSAPGPEVNALRELFGELTTQPGVTEHMAHLLAGSDVRYDVGDDHPLSGLMVPDLVLDDGRRVAELLHEARPVLLDLSGGAADAEAAAWSDRVDTLTATMDDGPAAILIRPDGYIAWATDEFGPDDTEQLRAALTRWFGA